jgi:hypothetical protein
MPLSVVMNDGSTPVSRGSDGSGGEMMVSLYVRIAASWDGACAWVLSDVERASRVHW